MATGKRKPIARSRIEYGATVDGVNVVSVFEAGDPVTVDRKTLQTLIACGAVEHEDDEDESHGDGAKPSDGARSSQDGPRQR